MDGRGKDGREEERKGKEINYEGKKNRERERIKGLRSLFPIPQGEGWGIWIWIYMYVCTVRCGAARNS